ncbi:DNA methyltransferase [Rhizobium bangladeshense]|uniref:McrB family protein n=1 Tax=Rhizobium bangladeshense TaxID=1138189 RepID=UPI001C832D40|nr:hypothetical protein [Rhizobium bangladeshense]MBX4876965.1 DNA methyltransferase [Rhizobium bangladeshense]
MAVYLSAPRIRSAITRLGESRAKRTPLFDFLIVKRTLAIKSEQNVAIAESEKAFIQALDEIGGTNLQDTNHYYFNPFALREAGKTGYRPIRYRSNGTNSTISGAPWTGVFEFTEEKPRRVSLKKDHEKALPELALVANERKPLPNLTDAAVWYWRGQDVQKIVGEALNDAERFEKLVTRFQTEIGLTKAEIDAVFDRTAPPIEDDEFVTEPPSPSDYLPVKALAGGETKTENLSQVSFSLVSALAAKNFVILTGPSGTGKSRAALKLAEGLQRYHRDQLKHSIFELIAVGPDWTSPKRLIGYRTPFGKERKLENGATTHESYEITDAIRLILRASHPDAADIPHFLIFDEMNLSHVERYFAPFLSLMEAASILDAEGGLSLIGVDDLKLIASVLEADSSGTVEAAAAAAMMTEGRDFILPPNLFFIGTVNVDETTYMFSPKVLDRAHVIELNAERPSDYLSGGGRAEPGGIIDISDADVALKRSIEVREQQKYAVANPVTLLERLSSTGFAPAEIEPIKNGIIAVLDGTYDLLAPVGFSFGYRVSKEVFVYVLEAINAKIATGVDKATVLATWSEVLDSAILQKLLPKIHGNRRALSDSLRALSAFYSCKDSSSTPSAAYTLGLGRKVEIPPARRLALGVSNAADPLPRSRTKLDAMHDRLQTTGYISFVS